MTYKNRVWSVKSGFVGGWVRVLCDEELVAVARDSITAARIVRTMNRSAELSDVLGAVGNLKLCVGRMQNGDTAAILEAAFEVAEALAVELTKQGGE